MNKLIRLIDKLIPLEFYYLKSLARPKAVPNILRVFTVSVMSVGFAVFIALYITESSQFTTETSIEVSDISDSEWSCSMASVVTQSVSISSSVEFDQFYYLMNINELKDDCIAALSEADPCGVEKAMQFVLGTVSNPDNLYLISVAPVVGDIVYFTTTDLKYGMKPYRYDLNSGILYPGKVYAYLNNEFDVDTSACSVAMDRNGEGFFVGYFPFADSYGIVTLMGSPVMYCYSCDSMLLTNDNFQNVYCLETYNVSGVLVNQLYYYEYIPDEINSLTSLLYMNQSLDFGIIVNIAVYCTNNTVAPPDIDSLYIYYLLTVDSIEVDDNYGGLFVYHNGESKLLLSANEYEVAFLQVSSLENKVFVTVLDQSTKGELISVNADGYVKVYSEVSQNWVNSFIIVENETNVIFDVGDNGEWLQQSLTNVSEFSPFLAGFGNSLVGWFVCNSTLMYSNLPTNVYSSICLENGLSWEIEFMKGSYFATEKQFEQIAKNLAARQCNTTVYETICERVGSLPPYICTRSVYLPFFTVLGSAVANAHLLTVILFICVSVVLTYFKSMSPNKDTTDVKGIELNPISKDTGCVDKNDTDVAILLRERLDFEKRAHQELLELETRKLSENRINSDRSACISAAVGAGRSPEEIKTLLKELFPM